MEWRTKSKQILSKLILEEDEGAMKPTISTISSDWIKAEKELNGFVIAEHEFLGVKLKTSVIAMKNLKSTNIKFRILNKIEYEPFMEESERRVADIVQVFPKEFLFDPSAELVLNLPSCVASKSCGQLVCLYCCNALVRHGVKQLKWKPLDSFSFHVNESRTEAKIICKKSGLYTIKVTQHPQVTKNLDIYTECEVALKEFPGIKIKFPGGCVARKTPVTLEVIGNEDLPYVPTPLPVSPRSLGSWRPPQRYKLEDLNSTDMVDITSSPVVLIRPSRLRFTRPVQLTLPLLGEDFEDFFSRENTRIAVLRSKVLDEETVLWKHHYSTPEIETSEDGVKVASFLITRGGLYKLVRRISNQNPRHVEQVSGCISRELCYHANNNFVTTSLRGLLTEIAEPGKQFVLRIALFDSSQPKNADPCFISEVCSQPLSLPLGKTRFLVRGSFEPDRDAVDHTEERTVMFTGKTTFVDFFLKLRLSDPTKLPDVIGKVSVHGAGEVQFYINLHKPIQIRKLDNFNDKSRIREKRRKPKPLIKRQTVAEFSSLRKMAELDDDHVSSSPGASGIFRRSLPMLSETPLEFSEMHSPCTSPPLTATLPEIHHSKSSQTYSILLSEFEEDREELRS